MDKLQKRKLYEVSRREREYKMTGIEKARQTAEEIKAKTEAEENAGREEHEKLREEMKAIQVEKSGQLATVSKTMNVAGLEEVPTSMIPLPFYKLVQPGSTKTTKADGSEATVGNFLMGDTGEEIKELKFLLLRAKRQTRTTIKDGRERETVSMAILGINLDRMTPFIFNASTSSFYNFGQLMAQYKERGIKHAWDFPITVTSIKREEEKDTENGRQLVKFWVLNFALGTEAITEDQMKLAQNSYEEYAASLDRNQQVATENVEDMPF